MVICATIENRVTFCDVSIEEADLARGRGRLVTRARPRLVTIETVVLRAVGKWQNLIASHVCRIFTVKRTIFDVVPIRSWSLAVSFSLYYEQTFCSHIFWWGGEGDAITLWEYMQYPRRRFIADETLEKQTFFFYAVPCDFIAKAASTVKLGCIERGECPAP